MAALFIDVLRSTMRSGRITVHDFVVMPNHVHILMTVPGDVSIEKAMQLIKGGFSFRANKELGLKGEIWQTGFSDVRIADEGSFKQHQEYIDNNPVKAGLANSPVEYPYETAYLKMRKRAGAEARSQEGLAAARLKSYPDTRQNRSPNEFFHSLTQPAFSVSSAQRA